MPAARSATQPARRAGPPNASSEFGAAGNPAGPPPTLGALAALARKPDRRNPDWWWRVGGALLELTGGAEPRPLATLRRARGWPDGLSAGDAREAVNLRKRYPNATAWRPVRALGLDWGVHRELRTLHDPGHREVVLGRIAGKTRASQTVTNREVRRWVQECRPADAGTGRKPRRVAEARALEGDGDPVPLLMRLVKDSEGWKELAGGGWAEALRRVIEEAGSGPPWADRAAAQLAPAGNRLAALRTAAAGVAKEVAAAAAALERASPSVPGVSPSAPAGRPKDPVVRARPRKHRGR